MTLGAATGSFDQVNCGMIAIRRDCVPYMAPDTFLDIQFRMIWRRILHLDFRMPAKEHIRVYRSLEIESEPLRPIPSLSRPQIHVAYLVQKLDYDNPVPSCALQTEFLRRLC